MSFVFLWSIDNNFAWIILLIYADMLTGYFWGGFLYMFDLLESNAMINTYVLKVSIT